MKKLVLRSPNLRESDLELWQESRVEPEAELHLIRLSGLIEGDARQTRWAKVALKNVRLSAVSLRGAHFEDVRFGVCDLANLDARQVFASRVEMLECRALGFCAPESDWRDAVFDGCNLSLSQFRHAKFERVNFRDCDLREADLQNADLRGVVFHNCDLRGAQFSFARLQNTDICTSRSDDLGVDAGALRGLIVSPLQAAQLAAILGLQVRWQSASSS